MLTAMMTPLIGALLRCFLTVSRKPNHSARSSSSTAKRPAVSSRMASVVNHQSQLRVPAVP